MDCAENEFTCAFPAVDSNANTSKSYRYTFAFGKFAIIYTFPVV